RQATGSPRIGGAKTRSRCSSLGLRLATFGWLIEQPRRVAHQATLGEEPPGSPRFDDSVLQDAARAEATFANAPCQRYRDTPGARFGDAHARTVVELELRRTSLQSTTDLSHPFIGVMTSRPSFEE